MFVPVYDSAARTDCQREHRHFGNFLAPRGKEKARLHSLAVRALTAGEIMGDAFIGGLERTHLTKIELGEKSAGPETLDKIAEALDMRLSELIRLAEDEVEKRNQ